MITTKKTFLFALVITLLCVIIASELSFYSGFTKGSRVYSPVQKQINSYSDSTNNLRKKMINEGILITNTNMSEVISVIKSIDFNGGDNFGESYKIKIVLYVGNDDEVVYFFNDNDLLKTKVFQMEGKREIPFPLEKLMPKDKIVIGMKYDFTKSIDKAAIEIKIVKLSQTL